MPEVIRAEHASQAGHWYTTGGEPAYEIVGKGGKVRNTTLRDARQLKLVPSVTTIIREAAAPGLQNWKDTQLILACLTMPRIDEESEEDYIAKIRSDAGAHAKAAAERGTQIHAYIQEGFEGKTLTGEALEFFESAWNTVYAECGDEQWECETSFATDKYGGKIDLISDRYLLDIKTTEKPIDGLKTWDNHHQQLAAYDLTGKRKCGIVYVNTINKQSRLIWVDDEDIVRGRKCFLALLDYFYARTGL